MKSDSCLHNILPSEAQYHDGDICYAVTKGSSKTGLFSCALHGHYILISSANSCSRKISHTNDKNVNPLLDFVLGSVLDD